MRGMVATLLPLVEELLELMSTLNRDVGRPLFPAAHQQLRLARARAITALDPLRWDVASVALVELRNDEPENMAVAAGTDAELLSIGIVAR